MLPVIFERPSVAALIGEDQPVVGRKHGFQREPGRAPDLSGQLAADQVDDVGITALERRQPRGVVGNHTEDQPLHVRRLAPILVERLEYQLYAGGERDEAVRTGADRRFFIAVVANFLDVLLRDDPPGARRACPIEGHEIGPGLLEPKPDAAGIEDLDRRDPLLEGLGEDAPIALEGELHVLGGDGLAVVELGPRSQFELVDEPVGRGTPRFGEAGRHAPAGHRLHEGVVSGREDHERRALDGLRGVEPGGHQRRVHGPRHLPFGGRVAR